MGSFVCPFVCVAVMVTFCQLVNSQGPPRLNIPGALLVPQSRPSGFRQARIQSDSGPPPPLRLRPRPQIPNAIPAPVRPVVEETEEPVQQTPASVSSSVFDDEVSNLGISVLQNALRQQQAAEEPEAAPPRPLQFRPERPVPLLRENIRDNSALPAPRPSLIVRQEQRENVIPRVLNRPDQRDENVPAFRPSPARQVQRPQPQPAPQVFRQPSRPAQVRQPSQYIDDDDERPHNSLGNRNRKPVVQILRKYRTDNPDGSITWGYENDDGSFKEETLGIDCVTKGKYGYVDPDGVKREYRYETGNRCDEPEQEDELDDAPLKQQQQGKQPQPQPRRPQPQLRPLPAQY